MVLLLPVLIQYLTVHSNFAEKNEEINFIKEYIVKQPICYSVSAYLCWNKENRFLLANVLNHINITIIIKNILENKISFPQISNQMYIVDISCENTKKILQNANEEHAFRSPNHWLLLNTSDNTINKPKKYELLKNIDVLIDSKFVIVQKITEGLFHLDYLYKMNKTSSDVISYEFANYSKTGVQYYKKEEIITQRKNFNFYKLGIGLEIMLNRSYDHLMDYRYSEEDSYSKLNIPLVYLIVDYLNATSSITFIPKLYNIGTENQNGSLLEKVISNEVDLPATPFFCLQEHLMYFDCIAMTTPVDTFFIYRRPPLSYVKNIYALPFGIDLWLSDLAFYLISAFLLYIIVEWEWKILQETKKNPDFDMIHSTFSDMLLFTMGAVCQQGYATEPKGTPGKILILTIFITLIFLFTAYSAYIVVLFQATSDDIKTLDDLYKSSMELGVEDQHYFRLLFSTTNEEITEKLYTEKIAPKGQKPHFYSRLEDMHGYLNVVY